MAVHVDICVFHAVNLVQTVKTGKNPGTVMFADAGGAVQIFQQDSIGLGNPVIGECVWILNGHHRVVGGFLPGDFRTGDPDFKVLRKHRGRNRTPEMKALLLLLER